MPKKQRKPQEYVVTVKTTPEYANPNPTPEDGAFGFIKPEKRAEVISIYREIYQMLLGAAKRAKEEDES